MAPSTGAKFGSEDVVVCFGPTANRLLLLVALRTYGFVVVRGACGCPVATIVLLDPPTP